MATKRISSHLILHRYVLIKNQTCLQFMMFSWVHLKFFTKLIIHNFIKKEEYRHLHGAVREYVINLKERPQVSMSHLDQLLMTLCSFWIGARLNHYQYHLIWEPGCHRTSFISNSQRSSQYHGLLFIFQNPTKLSSNIKNLEFLNLIFWFLKAYGWRQLLNLKILNLILSKILKLIVEAFQNYFYKIKVSKLK